MITRAECKPFGPCTSVGRVFMNHPVRSDFHIVVTEKGVSAVFKPTNSTHSFLRLTGDTARLGVVPLAGVQHAGHNTEDYAQDDVQEMARWLASEFAASVWPVQETRAHASVDNAAGDVTAHPARSRQHQGAARCVGSRQDALVNSKSGQDGLTVLSLTAPGRNGAR